MTKQGWAVVAPDGVPIWWTPTKRQFLDAPTAPISYKQVWKRGTEGEWTGVVSLTRVFRDVWPRYYKRGWRFKRATQTITLEAPHD